ncbi:hypothetical protein ACN26Z_04940 [Verrucosispora sp. WMMD703]|uniref:hypothetical protein n=1 Tax=Verrucosispora sp. WMMD703 TaxID=3403463 RepID=UPI003B944511
MAAGKGWTHRMVQHTNAALDNQSMAPAADDEVDRWHTQLQIHQNAVFVLNRLALSPSGQRLKELLGDAPFTAHSLLRRVARTLFGLPSRGDGNKRVEDLADDFYRHELQEFAESPLSEQPHSLDDVVAQVTRQPRTDAAVALAIDDWLDRWLKPNIDAGHVRREWFDQRRGLLRLVVEAAICAGRITMTFWTSRGRGICSAGTPRPRSRKASGSPSGPRGGAIRSRRRHEVRASIRGRAGRGAGELE